MLICFVSTLLCYTIKLLLSLTRQSPHSLPEIGIGANSSLKGLNGNYRVSIPGNKNDSNGDKMLCLQTRAMVFWRS